MEFSVLKKLMDSTHSLQEKHLSIYHLALRLSMQFIFVLFTFLFDKIEKTKMNIVKHSVTKTKAFYLQRVASNNGFTHKKYEILLLGSRAGVLRKTPSQKGSSNAGNVYLNL